MSKSIFTPKRAVLSVRNVHRSCQKNVGIYRIKNAFFFTYFCESYLSKLQRIGFKNYLYSFLHAMKESFHAILMGILYALGNCGGLGCKRFLHIFRYVTTSTLRP